MPAANIIELRKLLAERFPGLRVRADELSAARHAVWPTGLPQLDEPLRGGFAKGALAEVTAEQRGSGSALLLTALIHRALRENKFVAVVDGQDSLDVTQLGEDLSRLLWVRSRSADEALKAADLLLRDGNLPVVLLDLVSNPAAQLRKIPATTWYRFQRLIEQTSAVCVVFTPRAMVAPAQARIALRSRFSLKALEREPQELLRELKVEIAEARRFGESRELESRLA
ncbi:MAG TPA: hypothetical protein VH597_01260 [Verrucomicrobiae bacterium]|jgi:hypothetical protein|nr:hypothetical protein [Verrucomicrobiae bacterium]